MNAHYVLKTSDGYDDVEEHSIPAVDDGEAETMAACLMADRAPQRTGWLSYRPTGWHVRLRYDLDRIEQEPAGLRSWFGFGFDLRLEAAR